MRELSDSRAPLDAPLKETRRARILCVTCDVEIIEKEADLSRLLRIFELLDYYHCKGTFFIDASSQNFRLLKRLDLRSYTDMHEFGLHIHWGDSSGPNSSRYKGLRSVPIEVLKREMAEGYENCARLGFRPTSFRSGGLCQTTDALELVKKYGFTVDSSVGAKLNEKHLWLQNHAAVPYRSWYFPSKKGYDVPASDVEERIGILEIPVTRLIPSFRSWSHYTLTPTSSLLRVITTQWLIRSYWEDPLVITPIFHSWGDWAVWSGKQSFERFLDRLGKMIEYMLKKRLEPMTLTEVYSILCETSHVANAKCTCDDLGEAG